MNQLRRARWIVGLALLAGSASLLAGAIPPELQNGFEEQPKEAWKENDVALPAFPQDTGLLPFVVGAVRDKSFAIDRASIAVGTDGVIRYSLVITSSRGAQNVTYEGMRCDTGERRVYAYGRSDKTWAKASSDKWVPMQGSTNDYRVALYADYFCTVGAPAVMNAKQAIRRLELGGNTNKPMP